MARFKRKSIDDMWDTFSVETGVALTSKIQRQEMRRAFYGGIASVLEALRSGLDPESEPTDDDIAYLESLSEELKKFGEDIKAGKA